MRAVRWLAIAASLAVLVGASPLRAQAPAGEGARAITLVVPLAAGGSPHHLAAAMLNRAAGIDITHVRYRGTAPALNDLLGGQIPLIWATPNALVQFVEAGKVKPLATASLARIAILPQVPTIAESALP